ncbi:hypothetical protein D3C86_1600970 [compost metagenome]
MSPVEFTCRTGVDNRSQTTEHAHHADFLNHFAQHETRIFLHRSGGALADVGVFRGNENLHNAQHHHQAQGQGDQQFDQAEASLPAVHGVDTGSTVARLVRTKLRRELALLAARESSQVMVIV